MASTRLSDFFDKETIDWLFDEGLFGDNTAGLTEGEYNKLFGIEERYMDYGMAAYCPETTHLFLKRIINDLRNVPAARS